MNDDPLQARVSAAREHIAPAAEGDRERAAAARAAFPDNEDPAASAAVGAALAEKLLAARAARRPRSAARAAGEVRASTARSPRAGVSLRYPADARTLLWLGLAAGNVVAIWLAPAARPWLVPLACYFALTAGLIAHNHNHCPTFRNRRLNGLLNHAATVFYGFAAFSWIPTHNQNHHRFVNGVGDATRTSRHTDRHNAFVALTYPIVSMIAQVPLIDAYVREARATNRALHRTILVQLAICWGLPLALSFVDWRATLAAFWIPRLFSVYVIIFFNYVQHVHCDPLSQWSHSRSFTGRALNFFLFNNGFHAVHHAYPGAHWSTLPALHARHAREIDARLTHVSFAGWLVRCYLVAPFWPRAGTMPIATPAR